jgi:hypothetical protein
MVIVVIALGHIQDVIADNICFSAASVADARLL